jgi:hypothetical protein
VGLRLKCGCLDHFRQRFIFAHRETREGDVAVKLVKQAVMDRIQEHVCNKQIFWFEE